MKHVFEVADSNGYTEEQSYCDVCKEGEISLTTHCCGRPLTALESFRVVWLGNLDFVDGEWVDAQPWRSPHQKDKDRLAEAYIDILKSLTADCVTAMEMRAKTKTDRGRKLYARLEVEAWEKMHALTSQVKSEFSKLVAGEKIDRK